MHKKQHLQSFVAKVYIFLSVREGTMYILDPKIYKHVNGGKLWVHLDWLVQTSSLLTLKPTI